MANTQMTCVSTDCRHSNGDKLCTPLVDLFLYSYKADFIQRFPERKEKKMTQSFDFTFRYIDKVLSLNNSKFDDFVYRIYPIALEVKDTTETERSTSYLDIHLDIYSKGSLKKPLRER